MITMKMKTFGLASIVSISSIAVCRCIVRLRCYSCAWMFHFTLRRTSHSASGGKWHDVPFSSHLFISQDKGRSVCVDALIFFFDERFRPASQVSRSTMHRCRNRFVSPTSNEISGESRIGAHHWLISHTLTRTSFLPSLLMWFSIRCPVPHSEQPVQCARRFGWERALVLEFPSRVRT